MRNKDVYIITCSKCDKENRYEDYSCVGPDQRESIKTSFDLYRSSSSFYCAIWAGQGTVLSWSRTDSYNSSL